MYIHYSASEGHPIRSQLSSLVIEHASTSMPPPLTRFKYTPCHAERPCPRRHHSGRPLTHHHRRFHTPCVHTAHENGLVLDWLRTANLSCYIPHFRTYEVTPTTLLTLTSTELQAMGVLPLSARRAILAAIERERREPHPLYLSQATPEHARILNHLSNESLLLLWLRVTVIMLTVAVSVTRMRHTDQSPSSRRLITVTSQLLAALAIVVALSAWYRYYIMIEMTNYPSKYPRCNHSFTLIPVALVAAATIVTMYALMAEKTRDTMLLILLFV